MLRMSPGTDTDLLYCAAALRSVVRKTTLGSHLRRHRADKFTTEAQRTTIRKQRIQRFQVGEALFWIPQCTLSRCGEFLLYALCSISALL
jgi:hypothetical protein